MGHPAERLIYDDDGATRTCERGAFSATHITAKGDSRQVVVRIQPARGEWPGQVEMGVLPWVSRCRRPTLPGRESGESVSRWGQVLPMNAGDFDVAAMEEIAGGYSATPAQVALNWVIHFQRETVVTIPGATRVHQAHESAGAMRFRLSEDELARLDELSRAFQNPH